MARDRAPLDASPVRSAPPLAGLWQVPLLIVSLALFGVAGYLFINPQPGPGLGEQIERSRRDIKAERYDAAIGRLGDLLDVAAESPDEPEIRLLIAEALDRAMRRSRRVESPASHRRIIEETRRAVEAGATETPVVADRVARSYEALAVPDRAAAHWRTAVRMLEESGAAEEAVPMRRSTVEMLIANGKLVSAAEALKSMLEVERLASDERAWALGELARISVDTGDPDAAMPLLAEALSLSPDESIQGQVNFRLGYAAWKLGDRAGAEGYLTLARSQLGTGHALDAEACYLLGRIAQDKASTGVVEPNVAAREAIGFYEVVLRDHPGSRTAPKAHLGRAVCRLVLGDTEGGADDLISIAADFSRRPAMAPLKEELLGALRSGSRILTSAADYDGAIELMAYEQRVDDALSAEFYARLGLAFERQGDLVWREADEADESTRPKVQKRARGLWVRAGDAYVAYSRNLTLADDEAYGEALWHGISLYERAADLAETVAALELFVSERPSDPIAPEALLRLGRAYQAMGRQPEAVQTLVRLRDDYPQTLSAAEAAVPLAQAYVTQGRGRWSLAENTLRAVVENNPVLGPESQVFREATWELGRLYYLGERWAEALAKFEEFSKRYPTDDRRTRLLFLRGDCYRQAAAEFVESADEHRVEAQVAATAVGGAAPETSLKTKLAEADATQARRYLTEAKRHFEGVVSAFAQAPPTDLLDATYERMAFFYRADCLYDLGRYEEAIALYDEAAFRYQDDPSALSAYVQMTNAYVALGRADDAKAANERAKWVLRRIPPESFNDGSLALNRDRWQEWLEWTGESGLF